MLMISQGNFIPIDSVAQILSYETYSIRKKVCNNRRTENNKIIHLAKREKIRSVIIQTDGSIILCAHTPETMARRYDKAIREEKELTQKGDTG